MIHVACEVVQPGDVLVVACSSENTDGAFGELLATSVHALGGAGVVLDMGCRDAARDQRDEVPRLVARHLGQGHGQGQLGSVNVPVVCAGASVGRAT
jgi:4-hydroxy-4-methyl-2-oxoglutarate aldolase